jgi:hypothetical protein
MAPNVSQFEKLSVADTCSVWNVLSSRALHGASVAAGCSLSLTAFGLYECLHKPRTRDKEPDRELQRRLIQARAQGQFRSYPLDLEDLQDVAILQKRGALSKGELAAIAFARRTRQAFLTDDQAARTLAATAMDRAFVQTTPHMLGWLFFTGHLSDGDFLGIVEEHEGLDRPLRSYFEEMYHEAMRCRLLASATGANRT